MLGLAIVERIRGIFLHHESLVTIDTAARLLGFSAGEMIAAIDGGEIEVTATDAGDRIDLRELVEWALQRWPLETIERALGREASLILPAALRTSRLSVRLPMYVIAALRHLARAGNESVDAFLARELHELAAPYAEQLAANIPGYAEASQWPDGQDMQPRF